MTLLQFLVLGLATWRVSSWFVNEDGPFFVFEELRTWSGISYYLNRSNEQVKVTPDRFFPQLLSCVWCFSVYAGAGWMIAFYFFPTITFYCAAALSLSSMAVFMNLVVEKLKGS